MSKFPLILHPRTIVRTIGLVGFSWHAGCHIYVNEKRSWSPKAVYEDTHNQCTDKHARITDKTEVMKW